MSHAKVNPFYIQDDEEDPWDDDEDEYDEYDYDDEQVMLMSGNGGIKNRKYNDPRAGHESFQRRQQQLNNNFHRSYHNGQYEMHNRNFEHRPQLWKYCFLLVTIFGVIVFGASFSSENDGNRNSNVSLSSLIDEIPNKDIFNEDYRIVVLGERHSGTAWMRERLRECFPHVEVSNHLQRMGYFFQDDEATARSKAEMSEKLATIHSNETTTIVVHVTLNVYDWLEQMRLSPEYAPDHAGKHQQLDHPVPMGWKEFLQKPWTTERPKSDFELVNETGPVCQMGFEYKEVVSCSKSAEGIGDPMYELYDDGHPFGSIIDLRTAKLKNHHGVLESWPSVKKMIQVSYESTAQDFKSKLLHEIVEFTGWSGDLPCSESALPPSLERSKDMTVEFVEFVNTRADWETEQRIASYSKWTDEDIASKDIRSEASSGVDPEDRNGNAQQQQQKDEYKQPEIVGEEESKEMVTNNNAGPENAEETTVDESPPPPIEESNNEEKNESSEATKEEEEENPAAHSNENSTKDEIPKDSSSSTETSSSDEKVDEESPSEKDVDEGDASTEERGDTVAEGSTGEQLIEEKSKTEKDVPSDDKTTPKEESSTETEKVEDGTPPSDSKSNEEVIDKVSGDEEVEEGNVFDDEKDKEAEATKSEEDHAADDGAKTENNKDGDKR